MCVARLIGLHIAPLPPAVGGPVAVQGVKMLIKIERQDVHDTRVNQLRTQEVEALLYATSDSSLVVRKPL